MAQQPTLLERRAGARWSLELWHAPAAGVTVALLQLGRRSPVMIRRRDARELQEALGWLLEV